MSVPYAHINIHFFLLNCATAIIKCCLYVCYYSNVTNGNTWILYCIVLVCIALYWIVLHCIVLFCIVLNCIVLDCFILYCIVLYCIVLYCFKLYCITLFYIVLYCIVLYYIVLYCYIFQGKFRHRCTNCDIDDLPKFYGYR